jgi:phosphatidate cytidylyltransferase
LLSSVVALCVLGSFALQGIRKSPDGAIVNIGSTLMGLVYVWFLPGFLVKIRHLGFAEAKGWGLDGIELIAATLFVAKVSDIGGFFVGRAFGKHKMSPVISPKKTWEGAAGGALASILLTIAFRNFYPNSVFATMSMWTVVLFGFTMSVSSILGDLIESCMKRDSQQKDSGTAVPGFGGLLDVADSLMVAAPASYFFLILAGARPALEAVVK